MKSNCCGAGRKDAPSASAAGGESACPRASNVDCRCRALGRFGLGFGFGFGFWLESGIVGGAAGPCTGTSGAAWGCGGGISIGGDWIVGGKGCCVTVGWLSI